MLRIADLLQKNHDVVIFATTTPVRKENRYNSNSVICRYNKRIVPLLREKGVLINDLNSLLAVDINRYICEDLIHLTDEGLELCAKQTAAMIREAAKSLTAQEACPPKEEESDINGVPVLFE
jgi:lysophospholipase L1-like esterase